MKKAEALEALERGEKITHRTFCHYEYIQLGNGCYLDENGHQLNIAMFWKYRKGIWWETDWLIYKQQVKKQA